MTKDSLCLCCCLLSRIGIGFTLYPIHFSAPSPCCHIRQNLPLSFYSYCSTLQTILVVLKSNEMRYWIRPLCSIDQMLTQRSKYTYRFASLFACFTNFYLLFYSSYRTPCTSHDHWVRPSRASIACSPLFKSILL